VSLYVVIPSCFSSPAIIGCTTPPTPQEQNHTHPHLTLTQKHHSFDQHSSHLLCTIMYLVSAIHLHAPSLCLPTSFRTPTEPRNHTHKPRATIQRQTHQPKLQTLHSQCTYDLKRPRFMPATIVRTDSRTHSLIHAHTGTTPIAKEHTDTRTRKQSERARESTRRAYTRRVREREG